MAGRPKGSKNKATILRENAEAQAKIRRMMAEDDGPAYFVCACCGKRFMHQKDNFSPAQSELWRGNNHYFPVCKSCMDKLVDHYTQALGNEDEAMKRVCMLFDIYYSEGLLKSTAKHTPNTSRMTAWIRHCNMTQNHGKTFDTYLEEINGRVINDVSDISETRPNGGKVSQRMVGFWGPGFNEAEYVRLDNEYKDWITRYECSTKAQEELFKAISMAQIMLTKAYQTGDTKKVKEASDTLQNLLGSANIKPNQTNDNALAEANTFGTLIKKWEDKKPIPEAAPEWRDVDGIGKYFRTWVTGPMMELFKIKNPWQKEYEEGMAPYTAHRPEYTGGEEEENESIRNAIFGTPGE